MSKIVISYRRSDTKWITGRIFEHLENHFGTDHVFMDVDHIQPGEDFREHIRQVLDHCDVVIAIVGAEWQELDGSGKSRLHDENDWVRLEISAALSRKIPVVPVLIDGTKMPKSNDLPPELADFAFRQAIPFDTEDFKNQMLRLIRSLERLAAKKKKFSAAIAEQAEGSIGARSGRVFQPLRSASDRPSKNSSARGHIYISYAWDDDLPPPDQPDRKGFVTFLDEALRYEFRDLGPDRPSIWRDTKRISSNDAFTSDVEETLRNASCLVVILSPNWMASEWCNQELDSFVKYRGPDEIRERIFVVGKRYVAPERSPLLLGQPVVSFFIRSNDPQEIDGDIEFFDRGEVRDQRYWDRLKQLAALLLSRERQ
jgi:TIR domain-containing protein